MKQQRLDGLADGIFSIVMTLLVIELKVPIFKSGHPTDDMLISSLWGSLNIFLSLILSFALLFTYWRAHHFISSVYAKNLTAGLANINALFFFFITLVPFAAHFLGEYAYSQIAVVLYGMVVIAIGLTLFYMRLYIEENPEIETSVITKADRRSGYIRILFPVFSATVAIILSLWSTTASLILFTAAILFNVLPASSNIIHHWLDMIFSDDMDLVEGNYTNPMNNLMQNEEFICVPKSAVFDHHRFKEADGKARLMLLAEDQGVADTGDVRTMPKKRGKGNGVRGAGARGMKTKSDGSKIRQKIEKEIEKDIVEGKVEDVIIKKE